MATFRAYLLSNAIMVWAFCLLQSTSFVSAGDYELVEHPLGKLHFYRCDPEELHIFWKGQEQPALRTFTKLQKHLRNQGKKAVFMMNAGIFEPGGIPTGLHIENHKTLHPLNLKPGKGNFYLKPNGVFFIDSQRARILRSETYAQGKFQPRLATQSGPILLVNGSIHPSFRASSKSKLHRNGVGVQKDGQVLFIMTDFKSQARTNLYQFAKLFLDQGCQNALFLDGDLSAMAIERDSILQPVDSISLKTRTSEPGVLTGNHFGAIFAITKPLSK